MKKIATLFMFALLNISLHSQEKVILGHLLKFNDVIEVSLKIENKPNDNFHLIKIEALTVTEGNGKTLSEDFIIEDFRKANVLARFKIDKNTKYKNLAVQGMIKYFTPSENDKSYFNLGAVKNLKKNSNLIDKSITEKNPNLFFSIVNPETLDKTFSDFKDEMKSKEGSKNIDFREYDLIYSYKTVKEQDFVVVVDEELEAGFEVLTLTDKKTGVKYKLIKLKRDMTASEREQIKIELMIENKSSVVLIPFNFKKMEPKDL